MLRSTGAVLAADKIVAIELPRAIATLRNSVSITDAELEVLFAAEEERVADARALAEILLPMLSQASLASAVSRPMFSPVDPLESESHSESAMANGAAAEPTSHPTTAPLPGIADFIDEMLTQDRTPARPRGTRRSA